MNTPCFLPVIVQVEANFGDGYGWNPQLAAVSEVSEIVSELDAIREMGAQARVTYWGGEYPEDLIREKLAA